MEMIICDYHERECFQIEEFVFHYYQKKGCDIQIRCCKDWLEFSRQLRQKEADVVIVAQNGIEGLDIVTGLKSSSRNIIWFSDLDFGVQAYRQCVSYFNLKPITQEKISYALDGIETN